MKRLKQPTKFVHSSIVEQDQAQSEHDQTKSKIIVKAPKKVINKKNEPSALRMAAINETFQKIDKNTESFLENFLIDNKAVKNFLSYEGKVKCSCQRNIKYYCLKCFSRNQNLTFPKIELPLNLTILHHSSEKTNKSSIIPMKLLSEKVHIQFFSTNTTHDDLLKNVDPSTTFVLFPHKDSKKVSEIQNVKQIKNIVVLDCTWFQTDQILTCLQKRGLNNFIRLEQYESLYWRYNHHSDKALSSAEAFAYFLREYQSSLGEDAKKYDEIMFLYTLNLKIISNYNKDKQEKKEQNQQKA